MQSIRPKIIHLSRHFPYGFCRISVLYLPRIVIFLTIFIESNEAKSDSTEGLDIIWPRPGIQVGCGHLRACSIL
jgi:hypothetical protein